MKNFALAISAFALTAGLAASAHAYDYNPMDWHYNPMTWQAGYVSVQGGANSIMDNHGVGTDTGYSVDGAIGSRIDPQLRVEAEVGFQDADVNGRGDIGSLTLMGNGYYDFNNLGGWSTIVTPFIGLGLGAAHHEISVAGGGATEWDFAYSAMAGASYALTPRLAVTAEYKYLGTTDIETVPSKFDYNSHNFLAGLRYSY